MTRRGGSLPPRALAAYLEGEVTPSEAAAIESHVRDSGTARRHLEQLDEVRRTLARLPDDTVASEPAAMAELWRAVQAGSTVGRAPPSRWSRWIRPGAWMGAACAALVALLIIYRVSAPVERTGSAETPARSTPSTSAGDTPREFRPKAAAAVAAITDDRWVHIEVLRVDTDGVARPLTGRGAVHGGDALVFRYASGGPDPFGYLIVLAVDAAQDIHWYYPAYQIAGTDPSSISISEVPTAALPDAIEHPLPAGPLVFYGVFTRAPLHVLDVERRVKSTLAVHGWNPALPPRLPIEASGQHLVAATVVP